MTYADHAAAFGPRISESGKLGFLAEPEQDPTGCSLVTNPPYNDDGIALVRRGGCSFITKIRFMQKSGAVGVVVGDPDHPGRWITMYAPGKTDRKKNKQFFVGEKYFVFITKQGKGKRGFYLYNIHRSALELIYSVRILE